MLGYGRFAQSVNQPLAAGFGVCQGFNCCKGLGSNDKQCRFRVNLVQNLGAGRPVNIGDKITVNPLHPVLFQSFCRHKRPEVGTADTDIDDICQLLAGMSFKIAVTNIFRELAHLGKNGINLRHNILAVNHNRLVVAVAQSRMQNGASFGNIDFVATEHGPDLSSNRCSRAKDIKSAIVLADTRFLE